MKFMTLIGQTKHFSFLISFYFFSYNCIFASTCAILHYFCFTPFYFLLSPIPCLFAISTSHIAQLPFVQETLPLVLLSFCSLIATSSILHKGYYLPSCCPSLYAHYCSSWRQSLCLIMCFHFLPYFSWQCCLLFSSLFYLWTLPLLVFFLPTPETLHLFFYHLLSPHFSYSTLHYSISQCLKLVLRFHPFCLLLYIWAKYPNSPKSIFIFIFF